MKNTQALQLLHRQSRKSRLVFIDPTVEDYQTLVAGVLPDTEVIILDADRDGVEQISEILAGCIGITSLHIVSHGAPGRVYLGNTQFGQHTVNRYARQLMNWAYAFSADAQILLYGCDVAKTHLGKAFVHCLSELTGAVVFASDDRTGNAALGGDWELEVITANCTATFAFTPATLAAYPAVLSEPYLVKDIFPGSGSADISLLTNINGTLYFTVFEGELWKSDGSATGTVLVKDIYRGSDNEAFGVFGGFSDLININDTLYFAADDGTLFDGDRKLKLWKSNGTNAGTVLVKGINYRSLIQNDYGYYDTYGISSLTNFNGVLYFGLSESDPFRDVRLWKSDGTDEGIVLVKELYPDRTNFNITSSININGTLYFIVSTYNYYEYGIIANELWKSDGTSDGTVLVKEIQFLDSDRYYLESPPPTD